MRKAINLDINSNIIKRVLSIGEPEISDANPTGLPYIIIEDYTDPPAVIDPALDIAYPMYNTETKTFFWQVVNYQKTVTDEVLKRLELEHTVSTLSSKNQELQQVVDALLAESLAKDPTVTGGV